MKQFFRKNLNIYFTGYIVFQTIFHLSMGTIDRDFWADFSVFIILNNVILLIFIFFLRKLSDKWLVIPLIYLLLVSLYLVFGPNHSYYLAFGNYIYIVIPLVFLSYLFTIINILFKLKFKKLNIGIILIVLLVAISLYSITIIDIEKIIVFVLLSLIGLLPVETTGFIPIIIFLIFKDKIYLESTNYQAFISLKKMYDDGLITEEEYDEKKQNLLNKF